MAKKRKARGTETDGGRKEEDVNKRVRLNVTSYEDVAGSDDDFHIQRDKILLDDTAAQKRARKVKEREEFLEQSDEEVLGYSDDGDDAEDDEDDEEDFDDERDYGSRRKPKAALSDEDDPGVEEDEEDELNEWGASRQDYYGADQMETEQDALDEEAEAKRLQQKQLQSMTDADYGFDEDEWAGRTNEVRTPSTRSQPKTVTEILPQARVTEDMGPAERLKLLKTRFPEFEPLSKEFLEVQEALHLIHSSQAARDRISKGRLDSDYSDQPASALTIKERAASAYLATLGMYFALLTSTDPRAGQEQLISASRVREHPVMESMLSLRELWHRVKDLSEDDENNSDDGGDLQQADSTHAELVAAENGDSSRRKRKRKNKNAAERAASASARAAEAKRIERLANAEEELADLDALLARPSSKKTKSRSTALSNAADSDDSDLGEAPLSDKQLADKAAKRKSLRFYTSQIAQKAGKRGAAGRSAGGDDDIPHRERLRDRQARLLDEAAKRARSSNGPGEALGGDSDDEDRAAARQLRAEANDTGRDGGASDEDYYQTIASGSAARKASKEALAAVRKEALLNGGRVVAEEVVGADGKRKVSYAIEKNKGLTPRRKKEVRNPRVKKRLKYDERKKKLGSMKAVYKGGEGRGGYGGEATGIKAGIVKSRKL